MAAMADNRLAAPAGADAAAVVPAVGNMPPANNMLNMYAQAYFDAFVERFHITDNGTVSGTVARLRSIEQWFNDTYILISLITGIPLQPIQFNYDYGPGKIQTKNLNSRTLTHVYAMCYAVMLRMANTLNRPVPPQYMPQLQADPNAEE